ncbi:MAG: long-chain fatty acid--CoA ligase [Prevotella sp.]|nr:long-chain fatty acid--CoA ligase [Prevotella sp.]
MFNNAHLSVLLHEQAKVYGNREAMRYQDFGGKEWKSYTWNEVSEKVKIVSNALLCQGVKVQENIGIYSQNSTQMLFCDFGAWGVRAVTIPLYATSSEQQIEFIINDAKIRLLFVGEQMQYDRAFRVMPLCPTLEKIIIYDSNVKRDEKDTVSIYFDEFMAQAEGLPRQDEVETLSAQANEDELANILYTSGTTGNSKGVMLTHGQYNNALKANAECVPIDDKDRTINFLPFAHIFEKAWAILNISVGATLIVNTDPREIQQSMRETQPTCMSAVPRFWEKVYSGVMEKIETSSPMKQKLFKNALKIGRKHNIEYVSKGLKPPFMLHMQYEMMNKLVFELVRKQLGLSNQHLFPTAGATIAPHIEEFVHSIGINMVKGYGLTESLATVSCDHLGKPYTVGSVGRPVGCGLQIKISEEGEILLKGKSITPGYYNREDLNKESYDEEGYFRTGDCGYLKDGELFLTDRIKDLFKTSNGKYIAPQMIESKMVVDKYIDQIAIIADQRKFVSALIVPEYRLLEEYAKDNGIGFNNRQELCDNKQIKAMLKERIDTLQQQLAQYEQIKTFTLLPEAFSMEKGELTNTLKIKRRVLNENYKTLIDKMYEE